jgi:hypothetical protein
VCVLFKKYIIWHIIFILTKKETTDLKMLLEAINMQHIFSHYNEYVLVF